MWMVSPPADWFGKDSDRLAFDKDAAPLMMMNPFIAWGAVSVASAAAMMGIGQAMIEGMTGRTMPIPAITPVSKPKATAKVATGKKPKPATPKSAPVEAMARPILSKTIDKAAKAPLAKPAPAAAKPAAKGSSRPAGLEAPRAGKADDLKRISGVGPKLEMVLNDLGIYHFDQIAAWSRTEIDWIDDYLQFKGRVDRDKWIGQAKKLAGK